MNKDFLLPPEGETRGECIHCGECEKPVGKFRGCPALRTPTPSSSEKALREAADRASAWLQRRFDAGTFPYGDMWIPSLVAAVLASSPSPRVVPARLFADILAPHAVIRQVLAKVGMELEPNALDVAQDKASKAAPEAPK